MYGPMIELTELLMNHNDDGKTSTIRTKIWVHEQSICTFKPLGWITDDMKEAEPGSIIQLQTGGTLYVAEDPKTILGMLAGVHG